ncbi:transcriptional regulator, TetR family [Thermaerobacter marianensis DSM 12885]|uniref:Transcriptional regulator, TetR family n=1 Tax=Thermaerobacter marianensis (strain ATCC 700841 / DSM 12885 / JCM 10246 / 7p75a) TaxID=644966 RepID=E6SGH6_THEM7|nr:TetR/AcrR family transcriptional regulator [Thermaerobacter marianensis]ADU51628.1 transcriptional regulator, TetR family [Thermaerobacter marianensis DSM 12885]
MAHSKILSPQRETILQHAASLFARQGYPATTMRDLAAALGVTPAALYYHFNNKDQLLLEVMLHGIQMVHRRVQLAMAEGGPGLAERIWLGLRAHLLACLENQDFVSVILQESRYLSPEAAARVAEAQEDYERLWARTLEEGAAAGLFQPGVDLRLLRLFGFGAMNWVTVWYRPGGPLSPEAIADAFLLYMAKGVLKPEVAHILVSHVAAKAGCAAWKGSSGERRKGESR